MAIPDYDKSSAMGYDQGDIVYQNNNDGTYKTKLNKYYRLVAYDNYYQGSAEYNKKLIVSNLQFDCGFIERILAYDPDTNATRLLYPENVTLQVEEY